MTREDIIRMAREAGMDHCENTDEVNSPFADGVFFEDLEHFAQLVAAAERENWPDEMKTMERQVEILTDELAKAVATEREACAKVCEDKGLTWKSREDIAPDNANKAYMASQFIASAIRARGQQ